MPNYRALATTIRDRLGFRIDVAAARTADRLVPAAFLAGLVSVEDAKLDPLAVRYEPAVFEKLRQVRDSVLPRSYNGIRRVQIADAPDEALKALATSYGYTQIMGWHVLVAPLVQHSVAELRNPVKHLNLAVELLEFNAATYLRKKDYASVLQIWNTGRPKGKTYDPQYVFHALNVMSAYQALGKDS